MPELPSEQEEGPGLYRPRGARQRQRRAHSAVQEAPGRGSGALARKEQRKLSKHSAGFAADGDGSERDVGFEFSSGVAEERVDDGGGGGDGPPLSRAEQALRDPVLGGEQLPHRGEEVRVRVRLPGAQYRRAGGVRVAGAQCGRQHPRLAGGAGGGGAAGAGPPGPDARGGLAQVPRHQEGMLFILIHYWASQIPDIEFSQLYYGLS